MSLVSSIVAPRVRRTHRGLRWYQVVCRLQMKSPQHGWISCIGAVPDGLVVDQPRMVRIVCCQEVLLACCQAQWDLMTGPYMVPRYDYLSLPYPKIAVM